jgi:hypothetical protein
VSRFLVRAEALKTLAEHPEITQAKLARMIAAVAGLSESRTLTIIKQLKLPTCKKYMDRIVDATQNVGHESARV